MLYDEPPTVIIKLMLKNGEELELTWDNYYALSSLWSENRRADRIGVMELWDKDSQFEWGWSWKVGLEREVEIESEKGMDLEKRRIVMKIAEEDYADLAKTMMNRYKLDAKERKMKEKARQIEEKGRQPAVVDEEQAQAWINIHSTTPGNVNEPVPRSSTIDIRQSFERTYKEISKRHTVINFKEMSQSELNRVFTICNRDVDPALKPQSYMVYSIEEEYDECCDDSVAWWAEYLKNSIHGHDEAINKDKNFTKWLLQSEQLYFHRFFSHMQSTRPRQVPYRCGNDGIEREEASQPCSALDSMRK